MRYKPAVWSVNKTVKLSVIVPIYNRREYLRECLESIFHQTYTNMEVILVDDGSTDGSEEMCDRYAECYDFVKVIHQENLGLLTARKNGLEKAVGEYVGFVDSDDWVAADMYERLMEVSAGTDIVSLDYCMVNNQQIIKDKVSSLRGSFVRGQNLDQLLYRMMYDRENHLRGVQPSLCTKVIRRELLYKSMQLVDTRITLGEDAAIFYPCCMKAEKIEILEEYKYFYRWNPNSLCRTADKNEVEKVEIFFDYMNSVFDGVDEKYQIKWQIKRYVLFFLEVILNRRFGIDCNFYLFPYALVDKGEPIILYGAGKIGRNYYDQIKQNNYCEIVAWVDTTVREELVISPRKIRELEYTKILIAVKNQDSVKCIVQLLEQIGVEPEKIVWTEPQQVEMD